MARIKQPAKAVQHARVRDAVETAVDSTTVALAAAGLGLIVSERNAEAGREPPSGKMPDMGMMDGPDDHLNAGHQSAWRASDDHPVQLSQPVAAEPAGSSETGALGQPVGLPGSGLEIVNQPMQAQFHDDQTDERNEASVPDHAGSPLALAEQASYDLPRTHDTSVQETTATLQEAAHGLSQSVQSVIEASVASVGQVFASVQNILGSVVGITQDLTSATGGVVDAATSLAGQTHDMLTQLQGVVGEPAHAAGLADALHLSAPDSGVLGLPMLDGAASGLGLLGLSYADEHEGAGLLHGFV